MIIRSSVSKAAVGTEPGLCRRTLTGSALLSGAVCPSAVHHCTAAARLRHYPPSTGAAPADTRLLIVRRAPGSLGQRFCRHTGSPSAATFLQPGRARPPATAPDGPPVADRPAAAAGTGRWRRHRRQAARNAEPPFLRPRQRARAKWVSFCSLPQILISMLRAEEARPRPPTSIRRQGRPVRSAGRDEPGPGQVTGRRTSSLPDPARSPRTTSLSPRQLHAEK